MTSTLSRAMPAVPSSVTALRGDIAAFLVAAGIDEPLLTGVKLAVSEAATNAVIHAYAGAPQPGEVRLEARIDGDRVSVTVADDGCGMVPRVDSPGLGVGLPLIAHSADTLEIDDSGVGTVVRMTFRATVSAGRS